MSPDRDVGGGEPAPDRATGWLAANLRQRAAYEALCAADRAASVEACPFCGESACGSALCERARRKAEQQARSVSLYASTASGF